MPSSEMLCHVAFVRTDVSEERNASSIRATRLGELVRRLLVTANVLVTLMIEALHSPETSVLTRATRCTIQEDGIFIVIVVKT
jgi:hypothetical protein